MVENGMPASQMNKPTTISVRIRRGTSEESWYQDYQIPFVEGQSVFGVLQHIFEHLDPTLAFMGSCRIGLCSSCMVRVNGKVKRACTTIVKGDILVEPYRESCVVRDLVVETGATHF
jgi:succinate dehydrogenase / fumarate reductase iron-sulfur subunit